jgi:TolB protein
VLAVALVSSAACGGDPTGTGPGPTAKGPGREILFYHAAIGPGTDLYSINPDGTNLRNLTQDAVQESWDGDWSPDGARFIYSSDPGGGDYTLYIRNADGTNPVRVLDTPENVQEIYPRWSPDGKRIAYTQRARNLAEICVVNADGTGQACVAVGGYDWTPYWSPDGKRIGYTAEGPNAPARMMIMNADGTGARQVGPDGFGLGPWSPDGTRILVGHDKDIYSMRPDGTDLKQLTFDGKWNYPAAWSPDGKRILFTSSPLGPSIVFTMNADGSDVKEVPGQMFNNVAIAWRP